MVLSTEGADEQEADVREFITTSRTRFTPTRGSSLLQSILLAFLVTANVRHPCRTANSIEVTTQQSLGIDMIGNTTSLPRLATADRNSATSQVKITKL